MAKCVVSVVLSDEESLQIVVVYLLDHQFPVSYMLSRPLDTTVIEDLRELSSWTDTLVENVIVSADLAAPGMKDSKRKNLTPGLFMGLFFKVIRTSTRNEYVSWAYGINDSHIQGSVGKK